MNPTIASMKAPEHVKRAFDAQVKSGDEGARFALHGLRTRTNADRDAMVAAWAERSAK